MNDPSAVLFRRLLQGVYVIGVADGEEHDAFTAAWLMQVSYRPLLMALSVNPLHRAYRLLKKAGAFSVNVLKQDQLALAEHYGQPSSVCKLAGSGWTTDGHGQPLLPGVLAWFECRILDQYPAGDHVLMLGSVIDGKLLDPEAEPLSYRQTGDMDRAAKLFPDVFGQ